MTDNNSFAFENQLDISLANDNIAFNKTSQNLGIAEVVDLSVKINNDKNDKSIALSSSSMAEEITVIDNVYGTNKMEISADSIIYDVTINSIFVDLAMVSVTAAIQPFVVGQNANFQFTIANYGNSNAPNTIVGVNVDGTSVGLMSVGTILAGYQHTFNFQLSGVAEGLHEIRLMALPGSSVIDTNPSNNNIIRNFAWQGVPDLVAKTFETVSSPISPVDQEVSFRFRVSNEGTGNAVGTINNHLIVNGQEIGVISISNLNAGYTATINFDLTFSQPGTYNMLMHVNKNGIIIESNSNNNTKTNTALVVSDATNEFTLKMRQNAAYMAYYASIDVDMGTYPLLTGEEFASKVRSGGEWDYKLVYGFSNNYIYDGQVVTGEDMGNFHYGFTGRAATFGETLLLSAAGAYQIYSGTWEPVWWKTYFDDPNDQVMIRYGISMWDNNSWPRSTINSFDIYQNSDYYTLSSYEKSYIEAKILRDAANLEKKQVK
jgi:hypothetical protein